MGVEGCESGYATFMKGILQREMALTILLCFVAISAVAAHDGYMERIPNGKDVPNPCANIDEQIWWGSGHVNISGTGPRNDFGKAFKQHGKAWNTAMCQADSDGDGMSNGAELGDPDCVWTAGATPNRTTEITHPAICNDLCSEDCKAKNSWIPGGCTPSGGCTENGSTVSSAISFILVGFTFILSLYHLE